MLREAMEMRSWQSWRSKKEKWTQRALLTVVLKSTLSCAHEQ